MSKFNEENYYYGKICKKHPEENGLRLKSRRTCIACNREWVYRCRNKNVEAVKYRWAIEAATQWAANEGGPPIPDGVPIVCMYREGGKWHVGITVYNLSQDTFSGPFAEYWMPVPAGLNLKELSYDKNGE
jgi:hypothetical protein